MKKVLFVIVIACSAIILYMIRDNYVNTRINEEYQVNLYNTRRMWLYQNYVYDSDTDFLYRCYAPEYLNKAVIRNNKEIKIPDKNIVFECAYTMTGTNESYYAILYGDRTIIYIKGMVVKNSPNTQDMFDAIDKYYEGKDIDYITIGALKHSKKVVEKLPENTYIDLIKKIKLVEEYCPHYDSFIRPPSIDIHYYNGNYYDGYIKDENARKINDDMYDFIGSIIGIKEN